jgi:hypothetical protein
MRGFVQNLKTHAVQEFVFIRPVAWQKHQFGSVHLPWRRWGEKVNTFPSAAATLQVDTASAAFIRIISFSQLHY